MHRPIRTLTLLLAVILPVACGGPPAIKKSGKAVKGEIAGVVMKGLVAGATVTAYRYQSGKRGQAVGVATTDATGSFTLDVGTADGTLLLEAMSGAYTDEATGKQVPLGSHPLVALMPHFKLGSTVKGLQVNPVTTFVAAYTGWRMGSPLDEPLDTAFAAATQKVDQHFGGSRWASLVARDLTTATAGTGISLADGDVSEGLFLAGLSREAQDISTQLGLSDTSINAAALVDALARDIGADGLFDGHGLNGAQLSLFASNGGSSAARYDLTGDTLRAELSRAMVAFLSSPRNASGLTRRDADNLLKAIASDGPPAGSNPQPGQYIFATPGHGDIDPPAVTIDLPQENDGVRGDTPVKLHAEDTGSDIATLAFTADSQVAQLTVSPAGLHAKVAEGVLKAGTLPDGPFTLHAYAVDASGNRADVLRHVVVANQAPTITITSPSPGDTVSGTIHIQATATPNPTSQATLSSFQVVAPAGLTDGLPVTADLDAPWDTTLAPEGPYTIKLEAVDQYGSKATATVDVVVDNRPAPVIAGQVEVAGLPVTSPLVTVIALNDPSTVYPGGRPIGHAVGNDAGVFNVTLTDENYAGPLEIVASANHTSGSPTTYRDDVATPGGLDVSFGAGDQLSLYLPAVTDPAGGNWAGLAVSPWSTVADVLAQHYAALPVKPYAPDAAAARANQMIAGHFSRGNAKGVYDLGHAHFVDPGQPFTGDPWGAYPTLADGGLEQLAADLDAGQQPGTTSVLTLVKLLTADVADGVFDGKGLGGLLPVIQGETLSSYTTRSDFALEIDRYVNGAGATMGLTTLELKQAQLYHDVSVDDREIYPPSEPGHQYDTTPPTITWASPATDNLDAGTDTVDVDVSASDPVLDGTGVASFVVTSPASLAGTDLDTSTGRIHLLVDKTVAPNDGDGVLLTVKATDAAGNATTSTRRFTRPAPTVQLVSVTSTATGAAVGSDVTGPFRIQATGTEGYASKRLVLIPPSTGINDPAAIGPDTDTSPLGLSVLVDPTAGKMADGVYTFKVEHETIDGRLASDQRQLVVDNTAPTLTASLSSAHGTSSTGGIFVPRSGVDVTGNPVGTVTFDYTVADAVAGATKVELVETGTATVVDSASLSGCTTAACTGQLTADLPNGSYRFLLRATDAAGNVATSAATALAVDTAFPTFSVAPTLAGPKAPASSGGVWLPQAGSDATGPYASARFSFTAQDAPPAAGQPASGVASVSLTLTGTSDAGSALPQPVSYPLQGCTAGCTGTVTARLRNGDYTATVTMVDVAGNAYQGSSQFQIHVDAVPPTLLVSRRGWVQAPDGSWWVPAAGGGTTGDVALDYTARDLKSGVSQVVLAISGANDVAKALTGCVSSACTGTIHAPLANGTYVVTPKVVDAAGNTTALAPLTVHVDTTPPVFTTSPTLDSPGLVADGSGYWLPKAGADAAGNYAQALFHFAVQDSLSGVDRAELVATGTQTGVGAVSLTQSQVFGGCVASACAGQLAMKLRAGTYTLGLKLFDEAGNVTTSATWSVKVDTEAPVLTPTLANGNLVGGIEWIGDDGSHITGSPNFDYSVKDDSSGVTAVRVIAAPTGYGTSNTSTTPYPAGCVAAVCAPRAITVVLVEGTYDLHLEATDKAGNVSSSVHWTVYVDAKVPTPTDQTSTTGAGTFQDPRDLDFVRTGTSFAYSARSTPPTSFSNDDAGRVAVGKNGSPIWWKFENRLTGTAVADAAPSAQNLPVFYVAVADQVGHPNTANSLLEVDYQYEWSTDNATWVIGRSWTPAPAVGTSAPDTYFVLPTTDMLSAALAQDGTYHRITFRVRDQALNTSTETFEFQLHLLPAPVAVQVDTSYASAGATDPASLYSRTFAAANVQCVFTACSPQDLDNTFNFRVAHAVVYAPFAGSYPTVLQLHLGQSVRLQRTQHQRILTEASNLSHACVQGASYGPNGSSGTCWIAKAPNPANDDPPCLSQWGDPNRKVVWKNLDSTTDAYGGCRASTSGTTTGFPVTAPLTDNGGVVVNSGLPSPINAIVIDTTSNALIVPTTNQGGVYSYALSGAGPYDVYFRMPLEGGISPAFLSPTRTDLDPSSRIFRAYGVKLQSQELYQSDQAAATVYQISSHIVNGKPVVTCGSTNTTCLGWNTVQQLAVNYEQNLVWYGDHGSPGNASSYIAVNITNATNSVPSQRDPSTHQSTDDPSGIEMYSVYHSLTETGN